MAVLYVKEQGAVIQKRDERVIVTKNTETLLDIPLFEVDNIAIIGNVQVTTQALHLLMQNGIDVSYFTYSGRYLGAAAAEASKNIFLRFEQYEYYLDMERRLAMGRIIISNKMRNQIAMIRMREFTGTDYSPATDLKRMEELLLEVPNQQTPNELMGIEGMCSNVYFSAFAHMLKCDFAFTGRNRRPPRDPVNVILSLGYTFLTREITNALDAESFETYLGFVHGIRYGRKSLALDVVEEFRQPIIDRLTITLFNKRMIGRYDFDYEESGRVVLSEEGFRKFCNEYERWMTGRSSLVGETSYRRIIRRQISQLKKAITSGESYVPYAYHGERDCVVSNTQEVEQTCT